MERINKCLDAEGRTELKQSHVGLPARAFAHAQGTGLEAPPHTLIVLKLKTKIDRSRLRQQTMYDLVHIALEITLQFKG